MVPILFSDNVVCFQTEPGQDTERASLPVNREQVRVLAEVVEQARSFSYGVPDYSTIITTTWKQHGEAIVTTPYGSRAEGARRMTLVCRPTPFGSYTKAEHCGIHN